MKPIKFLIFILTALLLSCSTATNPEETEEGPVTPPDTPEVDISSYSNPEMNGNWRMSEEHEKSRYLFIDGNSVTLCDPFNSGAGGEVNGHLGEENFIYLVEGDTVRIPYTFDGDTLSTYSENPTSSPLDLNDYNYSGFFRDSDFNPCIGNENNSSFMFQFEEAYPGPYKYSVYINDEFLFDESSIEAGCAYSITPSESYTINVSVRYTYCLHGECAFSPQDFRTATYNETIQLEHLRNYRCNKLKMYGGWHDPDLEVRQDLGY